MSLDVNALDAVTDRINHLEKGYGWPQYPLGKDSIHNMKGFYYWTTLHAWHINALKAGVETHNAQLLIIAA